MQHPYNTRRQTLNTVIHHHQQQLQQHLQSVIYFIRQTLRSLTQYHQHRRPIRWHCQMIHMQQTFARVMCPRSGGQPTVRDNDASRLEYATKTDKFSVVSKGRQARSAFYLQHGSACDCETDQETLLSLDTLHDTNRNAQRTLTNAASSKPYTQTED